MLDTRKMYPDPVLLLLLLLLLAAADVGAGVGAGTVKFDSGHFRCCLRSTRRARRSRSVVFGRVAAAAVVASQHY